MLAIQGCLLNDQRLLNMTNVINPDQLADAWHIEGVPRTHVKSVFTPRLYGSSETEKALLAHRKLTATKQQIKLIRKEGRDGALGLANQFKDAIIKNCKPQRTMQIKLWNDDFTIECNKYKQVGTTQNAYSIYDSTDDRDKLFFNMATTKVPDLERFKLFFQTLLCHGIDSQVMDNILNNTDVWALPIHDAILALPGDCHTLRLEAVEQLKDIHTNRHTILANFRQSIGATGSKADLAFAKLYANVQQLDNGIEFSVSCMK